jgi:anaphase-promoting complex subunit 8
MSDAPPPRTPTGLSVKDPIESQLEARESNKFLLAKTYFDCREYDRCAAVFLPQSLPKGTTPPMASPSAKSSKLKGKVGASAKVKSTFGVIQGVSQKALFLALYAKYIAGEKRMNEESEMILGPQDGGVTPNKELPGLSAVLEEWFAYLPASGRRPQGWLEYLYTIVLAKGKNEKQALEYCFESVRCYPYNWGAWQELQNLLGSAEEVSLAHGRQKKILMMISSMLPSIDCLRTL